MNDQDETRASRRPTTMVTEVAQVIDRWVEDDVITPSQARRMRAEVTPPVRHAPMVAEGLGYLGGALMAVAMGLVAGRYWTELGRTGRPAVVAAVALALALAGVTVPRAGHGPAARLRAVLWLTACGAVLGFLLLLADDAFGWVDERALALAASGTLLCAAGFWAAHRHPVQHVVTYVSVLLLVGALVGLLPRAGALPGLAIWAMGVAWALSAWGGLVRPALLGQWLGGLGAAGGAIAVASQDWGAVLAVATVVVLGAAAVVVRDVVLLVVAAASSSRLRPVPAVPG